MRPRYIDLFRAMCGPDRIRADSAFDAVLRDRGNALEDIDECYVLALKPGALDSLFKMEQVPIGPLRVDLVQLLGFSGDPRAIPLVTRALCDPDSKVREEACEASIDLGGSDTVHGLIQRLKDLMPDVRLAAICALVDLRASEAADQVRHRLTDMDAEVRQAAAWALAQLEPDQSGADEV
ncbi:MAG: HEAT repeat domain-containing protein [Myxococcota bacterium]|nr:HEAT repeat domain-containing protein [Myxococcota bacterium]